MRTKLVASVGCLQILLACPLLACWLLSSDEIGYNSGPWPPLGCPPRCSGADLSFAELVGYDFRDADLTSTNLSNANLTRADFRNANLREADLSGADLTGADLSRSDLSNADLAEADLTDANLLDAIVTEEQLEKAFSLQNATMPDGTIHRE
jgi:uncharacterized protein YjbI with pentapeptide repeats